MEIGPPAGGLEIENFMPITFWSSLKKPIFALAPMHDVTDTAFRQLVAEIAKPDVLFTEFVAVDGLVHAQSQEKMVKHYLQFAEIERPIVAQIWGNNPDHFYKSAQLIEKLGFDGIDINMGCPDKQIVKLGGGAALIQDAPRAVEIIQATQEATRLPVSVKTRLGFNSINLSFIQKIAVTKPVAITIHARTKKELSLVPAHWEVLTHIAPELQKEGIIVLGNGDIKTHQEALQRIQETNVDGVMIGRGVFGNPWIFSPLENVLPQARLQSYKDDFSLTGLIPPLAKHLKALLRHTELFEEAFGKTKNFSVIKKHVHGYVHGFAGAKEMRNKIMEAKTIGEMKNAIKDIMLIYK